MKKKIHFIKRRKFHFKRRKSHNKNKRIKLFKIFLIISLLSNIFFFYYYYNTEPILRIFIMTHKDFKNYRFSPIYTIVADDTSQLKDKYNLPIIYATKGKLYQLKRAYSEMSKLYYIYQLYKNGTMSSKYIGLNHYRRYFNFTDNIPDVDDILKNNDVILNDPFTDNRGMKSQYCRYHFCINYNEIINIIKDIKPDYYETAKRANYLKEIHCCNLFIMKKDVFFKYCEFMYDILFEFDKRHNFKTDDEVLNYVKQFGSGEYHSRIQAFLSERIGNIFYEQNFKRRKIFKYGLFNFTEKIKNKSFKNESYKVSKDIIIYLIINILLSIVIVFIIFFDNLHINNFNKILI